MPGFVGFSSGIWLTVAQSSVALPPELQIGPWTCNYFLSSSGFVGFVSNFSRPQMLPVLTLFTLVNFIGDAFFDVLVVIFTVYRTGSLALQSKKANISRSLSFILLRDGTLYYSAIFAPQFVLVALFAINLNTGSSNLANISASLDYICTSLQAVLVNRLVLNLCHAANEREDSEFRTRTGLEPPTFATGPILDSIGGPVRTIPDDLDDDFLQGEGAEDMEMTNMSSANRKSYRNLEIEEIRL